MRSRKNRDGSFVHIVSDDKLAEFRHMSLRARLQWLEAANVFVNKAIGVRRRALFDSRFEIFVRKN